MKMRCFFPLLMLTYKVCHMGLSSAECICELGMGGCRLCCGPEEGKRCAWVVQAGTAKAEWVVGCSAVMCICCAVLAKNYHSSGLWEWNFKCLAPCILSSCYFYHQSSGFLLSLVYATLPSHIQTNAIVCKLARVEKWCSRKAQEQVLVKCIIIQYLE